MCRYIKRLLTRYSFFELDRLGCLTTKKSNIDKMGCR